MAISLEIFHKSFRQYWTEFSICIILKTEKHFLSAIEICLHNFFTEVNTTKYEYILAKSLGFWKYEYVLANPWDLPAENLCSNLASQIYVLLYAKVDTQRNAYIHLQPFTNDIFIDKYNLETLSWQVFWTKHFTFL